MIDKSLILSKIKSHLGLKKELEFANFLGIKQNTLSTWHSRNTFDIDLISQKCDFLNYDWLLTGRGEMLKNNVTEVNIADSPQSEIEYLKREIQTIRELLKEKDRLIEKLEPLADQVLKEMLERNKTK